MELDNIDRTQRHCETCEVQRNKSQGASNSLKPMRFKECEKNPVFDEALTMFSQFHQNRSNAATLPISGPNVQYRET